MGTMEPRAMRRSTKGTIIVIALVVAIAPKADSAASPKRLPHPIAEIGSTVFVNIGALRCANLDDLEQFQKFFHEGNMVAMDSAADRCLPDEKAKTPREEATGQRRGVLEKRDGPSEAQCVREAGSTKCVWVTDSQVEVEEDKLEGQ
jgi:hypothetical protein